MSRIIVIISTQSTGGTFLDWSLQFLSGQLNYYNFNKQILLPIPENPLTGLNAHAYEKNHSYGFLEFSRIFDMALKFPESLNTIYATPYFFDKLDVEKIIDYTNMHGSECVAIDSATLSKEYYIKPRNLRAYDSGNKIEFGDIVEYLKFQLNHHRKIDCNNFDVWELRETVALNSVVLGVDSINTIPNPCFDNFCVYKASPDDLFNNSSSFFTLMKQLGLPVIAERMSIWKDVHLEWSKIQLKQLNYRRTMKEITNAIICNLDYDLSTYKLDLYDESYILAELIHGHGKSLKLFGVEKFPNNTMLLHSLLEDSLHQDSSDI